jgi:hypothetical protein
MAHHVIRRTATFLVAIGGIADKREHRPRLARQRLTMSEIGGLRGATLNGTAIAQLALFPLK